jgi:hypothetical protein
MYSPVHKSHPAKHMVTTLGKVVTLLVSDLGFCMSVSLALIRKGL